MTLRVFISHSHKDNEWCDIFINTLQSYDIDIWYDKTGLYAGVQWIKTIEHELTTRDVFILILTPDSWDSEWVQEEIALALGQHKRIISVIIKPTNATGFITNRQMITAIGQPAADAAQTIAHSLGLTITPYTIPSSPSQTASQSLAQPTSSKLLLTLTGHTNIVPEVAWSPNSRYLATASLDHTARIWDAKSGNPLLTLSGHTDALYGIAWSPDSTQIATASYDHTARIWELS